MDTKIVNEEDVFVTENGQKSLIRGIISDAHPLGSKNNSAIVIAFNEASFAHQIKDTVRQNRNLRMGDIKIHAHLPPILDSLHNEAVKLRAIQLEDARKAGAPKKIHCNISLTAPWVTLMEIDGNGGKTCIPFNVEDSRLVYPAKTMAILALLKRKFKPLKFLSEDEKKDIPQNVLTRVDDGSVPMAIN